MSLSSTPRALMALMTASMTLAASLAASEALSRCTVTPSGHVGGIGLDGHGAGARDAQRVIRLGVRAGLGERGRDRRGDEHGAEDADERASGEPAEPVAVGWWSGRWTWILLWRFGRRVVSAGSAVVDQHDVAHRAAVPGCRCGAGHVPIGMLAHASTSHAAPRRGAAPAGRPWRACHGRRSRREPPRSERWRGGRSRRHVAGRPVLPDAGQRRLRRPGI